MTGASGGGHHGPETSAWEPSELVARIRELTALLGRLRYEQLSPAERAALRSLLRDLRRLSEYPRMSPPPSGPG
jgi:hypothetical protein